MRRGSRRTVARRPTARSSTTGPFDLDDVDTLWDHRRPCGQVRRLDTEQIDQLAGDGRTRQQRQPIGLGGEPLDHAGPEPELLRGVLDSESGPIEAAAVLQSVDHDVRDRARR